MKGSRIVDLEEQVARLRLDRARLRAANAVHVQTLAILARWGESGPPAGREFARQRLKRADEAAASVRPADLTVASLAKKSPDPRPG